MPKELIDIWQTENHNITTILLPVKNNYERMTKSVPDTAKHVAEYKVMIEELKTGPNKIDFTL